MLRVYIYTSFLN